MIFVYNLIYILALPLIIIRDFLTKRVKGVNFFKSKFGFIDKSQDEHIWIHGVSLGEVRALSGIVSSLLNEEKKILFTSSTNTGLTEILNKYSTDSVVVMPFPYDLNFLHQKIISNFNVSKIILFESEFWPNLIFSKPDNVQLISLNTTISEKTLKKMRLFKPFSDQLIKRFDLFLAQTDEIKSNLLEFQASNIKVTGNIKLSPENYRLNEEKANDIASKLAKNRLKVVAGSTHEGEEDFIIEALKSLHDMQLIIAPRHPERFHALSGTFQNQRLNFSIYSHQNNHETSEIVLFDKVGDLYELYSACDIAIVGGSIIFTKGHNFIEPIHANTVSITGENLSNFKELKKIFCSEGPVMTFKDKKELAGIISDLKIESQRNERLFLQKEKLKQHSGNYSVILSALTDE